MQSLVSEKLLSEFGFGALSSPVNAVNDQMGGSAVTAWLLNEFPINLGHSVEVKLITTNNEYQCLLEFYTECDCNYWMASSLSRFQKTMVLQTLLRLTWKSEIIIVFIVSESRHKILMIHFRHWRTNSWLFIALDLQLNYFSWNLSGGFWFWTCTVQTLNTHGNLSIPLGLFPLKDWSTVCLNFWSLYWSF